MTTVGTLQRLSAADLSELVLAEQDPSNPAVAIVDVRDDGKEPAPPSCLLLSAYAKCCCFRSADYIGGHIKGARNVPSRHLDAMLPTLVHQLRDKKAVVFHCALSQQRGPGAALRYIRERERVTASDSQAAAGGVQPDERQSSGTQEDGPVDQKVYVLDRGFVGWQEVYGEDERLTEGYRKDLWQDGYWG